jgi:hypothetical protein
MTGLHGDNTVSGSEYNDMDYGKYNTVPDPVILGLPDYTNKKNTLHNNINENVLLESIFQNKIFIDTTLKDYSLEPDLFKFSVNFSSGNISLTDINIMIEGCEKFSYKKSINGNANIYIEKNFRNVKNVSIDALIMPSYIEFITNKDGLYEPVHKTKISYKYIVLKIKELNNGRCYSNNKNLGSESFIMRLDDDLCKNNNIWVPLSCNIFYPDSQLKNIDKLTVEICDNNGNLLVTKLDGKPYDFFKEYRNLIDNITYLTEDNNDVSCVYCDKLLGNSSYSCDKSSSSNSCDDSSSSSNSCDKSSSSTNYDTNKTECNKCKINNLIPKLVSLRRLTSYLSPELHMTFSTLEPQINTRPTYRC